MSHFYTGFAIVSHLTLRALANVSVHIAAFARGCSAKLDVLYYNSCRSKRPQHQHCCFLGLLLYVNKDGAFMPALLLPAKRRYNYTATVRVVVSDKHGVSNFVDVPVEVSYAILLLVCFPVLKHNCYVWLINIYVHNQYICKQPIQRDIYVEWVSFAVSFDS